MASPSSSPTSPSTVVEAIFERFRACGGRHYGENVTELEHALQSATFANRAGEPDFLVAAALLHDYGHLLHDLGETIAEEGIDGQHEALGAQQLAAWFPEKLVAPIRMHVDSKRYLCWKDPAYLRGLSQASIISLGVQGGPMTDDEAKTFELSPHFLNALRLRGYDDQGKVVGMQTPTLESFRGLLESCVELQ